MKVRILNSGVEFFEQPFLKPLQLSSGLITQCTEARVSVQALVDGREASGVGSIYLSDLWAWPGASPDRDAKELAMRAYCRAIADSLADWCGGEEAHPLELGLRLHHAVTEDSTSEAPLLARSVCASPFDAAIHDAVGRALDVSAFAFYETPAAIPSADKYFSDGATRAIQRILRAPVNALDAWWLVSAKDDLENVVRPAIEKNGIRCFKLKVLAKDNTADAQRAAEVYRAAKNWGLDPTLSIDSNEGNPDAESVGDFLDQLQGIDAGAYAALSYLEQPTARDIVAHPNDWSVVGKRKPVLLDEGLTSLELLPVAKEQGWTGFALKTCKGHSFTLACAAWARQNGLLLSLQDLTNPGYSAIHSFLVGAHVSTINGVELNSPQYTPAANEPWLPELAGLFQPRGGRHVLEKPIRVGLAGDHIV